MLTGRRTAEDSHLTPFSDWIFILILLLIFSAPECECDWWRDASPPPKSPAKKRKRTPSPEAVVRFGRSQYLSLGADAAASWCATGAGADGSGVGHGDGAGAGTLAERIRTSLAAAREQQHAQADEMVADAAVPVLAGPDPGAGAAAMGTPLARLLARTGTVPQPDALRAEIEAQAAEIEARAQQAAQEAQEAQEAQARAPSAVRDAAVSASSSSSSSPESSPESSAPSSLPRGDTGSFFATDISRQQAQAVTERVLTQRSQIEVIETRRRRQAALRLQRHLPNPPSLDVILYALALCDWREETLMAGTDGRIPEIEAARKAVAMLGGGIMVGDQPFVGGRCVCSLQKKKKN
jgi:hypothetical protein